jgi:hypothetical protein
MGEFMKIYIGALFVVAGMLGSSLIASPAQASEGGWEWCSSVTVKSSGTKKKTSLNISGSCDGGSLRLKGSMSPRSGNFSLRGSLGGSAIRLGGDAGSYASFSGYIDDLYVDIDGSGSSNFCDLDGWIGDEYASPFSGSMFGRICPMLVSLRR